MNFLDTIFNGSIPECTEGIILSMTDRLIFWIGGFIIFLVTSFILIGTLVSKTMREQPGDLIFGIALSDFILSIYWMINASFAGQVDNPNFCVPVGALGVFAAGGEFVYNAAFSIYLIISLRNALRQSVIPKKAFHLIALTITSIYVGVLLSTGEIGKTMVGTCAIRAQCESTIYSYFGIGMVASYALLGVFTYIYLRKNVPKCERAHSRRARFLFYYIKYISMCIAVYLMLFISTLLTTLEVRHGDKPRQYDWINSFYNFFKFCSPVILSIFRLNDPSIKSVVKKSLLFWKKPKPAAGNSLQAQQTRALLGSNDDEEGEDMERNERINTDLYESVLGGIFSLPKHRKIELTYTLISCVLYTAQCCTNEETENVYNERSNNRYKHERFFLVNKEEITTTLPPLKSELERTRYTILNGTFKVYAPELFKDFIEQDRSLVDIGKSLDFIVNREQIKQAGGASSGKSGEFFFFSRDRKLIIKTIPNGEMKMLISILQKYEEHFNANPNSLIAKIYGAYTYENTDLGLKFNIILIKNICGLPSRFVERIYDLKGSRYDREVMKNQEVENVSDLRGMVLKDMDFEKYEKKLWIRPELKEDFIAQIEKDSMFFRSVKLIDYSFMVFLVNKRKAQRERSLSVDANVSQESKNSLENIRELGVYYNVGIIDYLQEYNFKKAFERFMKRLRKLSPQLDTSSQDPNYYSQRFIRFITNLVVDEGMSIKDDYY